MKINTIHIARFKVETASALKVGSGEKGVLIENLIARDANGLPYIPGTSLAGIVRHELSKQYEEAKVDQIFGFQSKEGGQGSRIIFSAAHLLKEDNFTVCEGIEVIDFSKPYYYFSKQLPERDHVRINDRGTAVTHAKYEEELVRKGTRFVFEIEFEGQLNDWETILNILNHPMFRVGAGTRKGFGQLKILYCKHKAFDLELPEALKAYLMKSSSLNAEIKGWTEFIGSTIIDDKWLDLSCQLQPENFYLFGSGIGDADADATPKVEQFFEWNNNKPVLSEECILIPATSIKGAIAHRVAYHYNRLTGFTMDSPVLLDFKSLEEKLNPAKTIEQYDFGLGSRLIDLPANSDDWETALQEVKLKTIDDISEWKVFANEISDATGNVSYEGTGVGEHNEAVRELFGFAADEEDGARGKVLFSDIYLKRKSVEEKIFNHVAIDRFTGGGIDGALFQEKVVHSSSFKVSIIVEKTALSNPLIEEALKCAIEDLEKGNLPLGGNTTKGHGIFIKSD